MKKLITLNNTYKALLILSICSILISIWGCIGTFILLTHQFAMHLLSDDFLGFFEDVLTIVLCYLRWRIVFLYSLLLNGYAMIAFAPLGYSPVNFFHIEGQAQAAMFISTLLFIVSIIGGALVIKEAVTTAGSA